MLRLPTIRDRFTEIAAAAQREQLSYLGFLAELAMAECDDRDRRRAARRVHDAGFPRGKRIEGVRLRGELLGQPGADRPAGHLRPGQGRAPAVPDRRQRHRQVLSAHRARHGRRRGGYRVRYTLASKLVNELAEAADDRQLSKTIARYGRVDLLCLDELRYMELDRRGAELLFQVLTEREERSAIAIASNEPRMAGPRPSPTPRLCAAIVDRLTFAGQIIETGTTSYRLAHARKSRGVAL